MEKKYSLPQTHVSKLPLIAALGFLISFIGYFVNKEQFFFSYLTSFMFWLTIALSGLFLTMLHFISGARWSTPLRRIFENLMILTPYMIIVFVPLVFGLHELYHWTHSDAVAKDEILAQKTAYLNVPFFLIRSLFYFFIWFLLARYLFKHSINNDRENEYIDLVKMKKISAPGMILFALSVTFASFDWVMSLDPHWYSTIFGVYIFAGSTLSGLAVVTLLCMFFLKKGILEDVITENTFHDLGKLLFTFTVFWAYIALSQYFLIWYGNIPEETIFYQHRWDSTWKITSLIIVFGHFVIPFFALMPQSAKRNFKILSSICILLLVMHWLDLHWLIMPNLYHHEKLSWMDLGTMLGIGSLFIWYFWTRMSKHSLIPLNDPSIR